MKVFLNGKNLKTYPITQTEAGPAHINLRYAGVLQHPLDFDINVQAGYPITFDCDVKVIFRESTKGNYMTVNPIGTPFHIVLVHVYKHAAVGTTVKAGSVVCRLAPKTLNGGYGVHLHIASLIYVGGTVRYKESYIRNIIFADSTQGIHKGMRVEFSRATNLRKGHTPDYAVTGTAQPKAVAEIIDGLRYNDKDGYTRFDCKFSNGTGWCIDNWMRVTSKPITPIAGPVVPIPPVEPPPTDPCKIYKDKVVDLEKRVSALNSSLKECNGKVVELEADNKELSGKLDTCEEQVKKYQRLYQTCKRDLENCAGNDCVLRGCKLADLVKEILDRIFGGKLKQPDG